MYNMTRKNIRKNNPSLHPAIAGKGGCALQQNTASEIARPSLKKDGCHLATPRLQATNHLQFIPGG